MASSEYTEASEGDMDDFVDDYVSAVGTMKLLSCLSVYNVARTAQYVEVDMW